MSVDLGGLMRKSIAIWPSLNGSVRLAAETSDSTSVWRNGGTWGNSEKALQPDGEHDTPLLNTMLTYFGGRYNAKPTVIGPHVVILKVKPWQMFGLLKELMQILMADGDDITVTIPARHPAKI